MTSTVKIESVKYEDCPHISTCTCHVRIKEEPLDGEYCENIPNGVEIKQEENVDIKKEVQDIASSSSDCDPPSDNLQQQNTPAHDSLISGPLDSSLDVQMEVDLSTSEPQSTIVDNGDDLAPLTPEQSHPPAISHLTEQGDYNIDPSSAADQEYIIEQFNVSFKCNICSFRFKRLNGLNYHKLLRHNISMSLPEKTAEIEVTLNCSQPSIKTSTKTDKELPYEAAEIDVPFRFSRSSIRAFKKKKGISANKKADYSTPSNLMRHISSQLIIPDNAELLKCDICSFKSSRNAALQSHKRSAHRKQPDSMLKVTNKRYKCTLCPYRGTKSTLLKLHYIIKHKNEVPSNTDDEGSYQNADVSLQKKHKKASKAKGKLDRNVTSNLPHPKSPFCDFICHKPQLLRKHAKSEHDFYTDHLTCITCFKHHSSINGLKKHYQFVHGAQFPFPCSECSLRCASQKELDEHISKRHSIELSCSNNDFQISKQVLVSSGPKTPILRCIECGSKQGSIDNLDKHMEQMHPMSL